MMLISLFFSLLLLGLAISRPNFGLMACIDLLAGGLNLAMFFRYIF